MILHLRLHALSVPCIHTALLAGKDVITQHRLPKKTCSRTVSDAVFVLHRHSLSWPGLKIAYMHSDSVTIYWEGGRRWGRGGSEGIIIGGGLVVVWVV